MSKLRQRFESIDQIQSWLTVPSLDGEDECDEQSTQESVELEQSFTLKEQLYGWLKLCVLRKSVYVSILVQIPFLVWASDSSWWLTLLRNVLHVVATFVLSDIVDMEIDAEHEDKKERPLPSGKVSGSHALSMVWMFFIMSFVIGAYTLSTFDLGIFVISLIFSASYSSICKKASWFVKNGWVAGLWASFMYLTDSSVSAFALTQLFINVIRSQIVADVADIENDKEFGVKTFATTYSHKIFKYFLVLLIALQFTMEILQGFSIYSFLMIFLPSYDLFLSLKTNQYMDKKQVKLCVKSYHLTNVLIVFRSTSLFN